MKLGNSNGNNKGKKYFVRGRDDQNLDMLYAEHAERFATWFAHNMLATRMQLLNRAVYDDDVLSETYLRIYEIILYTGRQIKDYASYFHRAYFTNFIQLATKENRYIELFANYDVEEDEDSVYFEEIEAANRRLEGDIMSYVYDKYSLNEFEIFKMYINLKPAIGYHQLAELTNLKYNVIQSIISSIMRDVKNHPLFVYQRKRVAS